MKIIGITGNSGSGKSYLAEIFKEQGGFLIDTDKLGHMALLSNSYVFSEIVEFFGDTILDSNGEVNRKALGKIVFSNKDKLKKLESISHKFIKNKITETIENLKGASDFKFIIIDGALLIESNIAEICDVLILADASYNTKINRIVERDNITIEQGKQRFSNQLNFSEYKDKFHYIISTEKTKEQILDEVKKIIAKL